MTRPSFTSRARRFADGGMMAPPMQDPGAMPGQAPPQDAGAGAGAGADPGAQLQAAATQYAQTKDPQLAVQIADMVVEVMGLGGGGGAPAPGGDPGMGGGAPMDGGMGGAPMGGAPQMNRKGGKLPSFGNKANGSKPVFTLAKKGDPAPGQEKSASGKKPMDALQKLQAKRAAKGK